MAAVSLGIAIFLQCSLPAATSCFETPTTNGSASVAKVFVRNKEHPSQVKCFPSNQTVFISAKDEIFCKIGGRPNCFITIDVELKAAVGAKHVVKAVTPRALAHAPVADLVLGWISRQPLAKNLARRPLVEGALIRLQTSNGSRIATLKRLLIWNPDAKPQLRLVTYMLPKFAHRVRMAVAPEWPHTFRIEDVPRVLAIGDSREYDYDTLRTYFGWRRAEQTQLRIQLVLNPAWGLFFAAPIPADSYQFSAELAFLYIFVRGEEQPRAFRLIDRNENGYLCAIRMDFVNARFKAMKYDVILEGDDTVTTQRNLTGDQSPSFKLRVQQYKTAVSIPITCCVQFRSHLSYCKTNPTTFLPVKKVKNVRSEGILIDTFIDHELFDPKTSFMTLGSVVTCKVAQRTRILYDPGHTLTMMITMTGGNGRKTRVASASKGLSLSLTLSDNKKFRQAVSCQVLCHVSEKRFTKQGYVIIRNIPIFRRPSVSTDAKQWVVNNESRVLCTGGGFPNCTVEWSILQAKDLRTIQVRPQGRLSSLLIINASASDSDDTVHVQCKATVRFRGELYLDARSFLFHLKPKPPPSAPEGRDWLWDVLAWFHVGLVALAAMHHFWKPLLNAFVKAHQSSSSKYQKLWNPSTFKKQSSSVTHSKVISRRTSSFMRLQRTSMFGSMRHSKGRKKVTTAPTETRKRSKQKSLRPSAGTSSTSARKRKTLRKITVVEEDV